METGFYLSSQPRCYGRTLLWLISPLVRTSGESVVAGMAEAFHLPVVSHLLPEMAVHLIAGVPNGLTVEYMPRTLRLFEETPHLESGQPVVPRRPGWGLKVAEDAIKRY